ncbi:hypothetical protein [Actomonas aquatica]|uniref:Uncharacterized protein n=1 Tax=Actomonas aquatica TaxID=2866162 RepID=A0ABZ1CBN2_9BACT|nr:hypothetical protein [Opitutus sp. WL0086]WRQ88832.1 hypothetical protein K1X11_005405 [Opitutus sp. WL0086]
MIFALPDPPENRHLLGHAFASGLFYSAIGSAALIATVYEKK